MHCITIYVSIGQSNLSEAAAQQTFTDDYVDKHFLGVVSQMQPEDFFAFVDTYITYSFVSCPSSSQVEGFLCGVTIFENFCHMVVDNSNPLYYYMCVLGR